MQGSSVVIIPPSGDMSEYIESTRKLLPYPMKSIAPGHGNLLTSPSTVLDAVIHHRLMREDKVVRALLRMGESSLDALLPEVYRDVDKFTGDGKNVFMGTPFKTRKRQVCS